MENFKSVFNKKDRTISVTYQIKNQNSDGAILHAIIDIVRKNELRCSFGEDDRRLRYMHISGTNIDNLEDAFWSIEELKE